ncbi:MULTISPECIES: hypothetical protein [unclassified Rhizobium]|uniref:hypothetical protein n=1 Tax=unclassified Rhizobium TaxID=2613769 RepID=UPI001A98BD75|nr:MULTISPECIES: hypothetical protein [unclassified Rhizobium]MBX5161718.1 hypothetical protein [Rhizobium sp. NZLR8]MBX5168216.1 hypothetical protein [Rhizobium sp. NZLR4b]MBX5173909.1 hypothetical protein [Rhizobium sp. NZLR1b]MBX5185333.1 hypothetical protein [Rhizobium sp. NZLR5]MBX5202980.1 hypothetical protein [Rhizobium sp. NZLR1]
MSNMSIWNIVQALSAFKSQRRRDVNHEHALRQLRRFPSHLLADCQPKIELTVAASASRTAAEDCKLGVPHHVRPSGNIRPSKSLRAVVIVRAP